MSTCKRVDPLAYAAEEPFRDWDPFVEKDKRKEAKENKKKVLFYSYENV